MSRARHLLVVGAQRCGTTYLHDQLAAHPQVAMARPARPEPKVFLSDEVVERGADWYRATWFAHATDETVLGEKSTSYLEYAACADRAAAVLGDPLVLVQLRDPVARAASHWSFSRDSGLEERPLAEALERNLEGPLPWDPRRTSVSPYAYLERGRYADYLAPWLERFGDDVTVLLLEDLVADPTRIRDAYAAIGVDPGFVPAELGVPVNESSRSGAEGLPADLPADLAARLRDHFAESDRALAELLGRSLPWRDAAG
ncbi:sulfotransferase family protein [Nocardioides sp. GCM10027113]|uniref:sulfotransferase family protein n=1 Tax=unclassified Nocardioides TaxID=2615069 RepID=UPI00361E1CC7